MTLTFLILLPLIGAIGLLLALMTFQRVRKRLPLDPCFAGISSEILRSLVVFLIRSGLVFGALLVPLALVLSHWVTSGTAGSFAAGTLLSAGVVALCSLTAAHTVPLTLKAAGEKGSQGALAAAYSGASVCGLVAASAGLISLSLVYFLSARGPLEPIDLVAFILGGTWVSLLCRLGGGIFSKAANLTASVVGRLEPALAPEDHRNPASIAEKAGNYAGSLCGAVSELLEVWGASIVATVLIASSGLSTIVNITNENRSDYMSLPVLVGGIGLGSSIISLLVCHLVSRWDAGTTFRFCHLLASAILLGGVFLTVNALELELGVFYAILLGVVSGLIVGLLTEWYTSGPPIRRIAQASSTGTVTNILAGLTVGMQSTALPVLTISGAVLIAYNYAGIYGIGMASAGMLANVSGILTVSAFGPIIDTASGVVRLAGAQPAWLGGLTRLHLTGNSTTAVGKSLISSASALASLALLSAYARLVGLPSVDLVNPTVIVGFLLGGILPFFLSDAIITSIGKAAFAEVEEARRQFREIAGVREGTAPPDNARFAVLATWTALKEMTLPLLVSVASPVIIGQVLGRATLAGMMAGALVSAVLLGLFMVHSGTAWDNARKQLELSSTPACTADQLQAAQAGDLVGDPFKDACGPSVIVLVRLMAITALIASPLLR
ncbi:MAG: sodium/proton-translocating pyrophosphatase [Acidobacteriota bacterium]